MSQEKTAKARYAELKLIREPFLRRARECARLTIPTLLPPEGHSRTNMLPQPYQGLGARCSLNLASRLMTSLLPPGQSFHRLVVPSEVLAKAGAEATPPDLDRRLSLTEKIIGGEVERKGWRQPTHTSLLLLVVTGNSLEMLLPDNRLRVFRLDQYVVARDPSGTATEIITEEHLMKVTLTDDLRPYLKEGAQKDSSMQEVCLYTRARLNESGAWDFRQELEDVVIPETIGEMKVNRFIPLRWSPIVGEDYGRSKVEEHLADIMAVDGLSKAVLDGAAMASRNIPMIRPNAAGGLNLRKRIAQAKNGEFVVGNPDDIGMLQFQNVAGMQFTSQELTAIKQELAAAFLLNSAMRRDAERVTAYELRQVVEELEGTLGGVYSTLAQEMMLPRLSRLIFQMQDQGQLPQWPNGKIEPVILTGLEALGREQDVNRVMGASQFMQGLPPDAQDYVKWPALLQKGFTGLGLADAIRSEDEVAAIQQRRAMLEAMARAAAPVAGAVANAATEQPTQ